MIIALINAKLRKFFVVIIKIGQKTSEFFGWHEISS